MRILKLTPAVEQRLLAARHEHDREAERIAANIIADVRKRGDIALAAWVKKLDGMDLHRRGVWVSRREINAAEKEVSRDFLRAVRHAAKNIRRVAEKQLPRAWSLNVEPGVTICQLVRPIEAIGCYIPGGRFALVSTLLMTVVPAMIAGVNRIMVVCPKPNPELLAAAHLLGVTRIARIGGAQAIAALAYGTKQISRVDKIFGPGNRYRHSRETTRQQRLRHRSVCRPDRSHRARGKRQSEMDRRGSSCAGRACPRRGEFSGDSFFEIGEGRTERSAIAIDGSPAKQSRALFDARYRRHLACAVDGGCLRFLEPFRGGTP